MSKREGDERIALTEEQCDMLITQLVEAAGPDGISEEDLRRQFDKAEEQLVGFRIDGALWSLWSKGTVKLAFTEDESDLRFVLVP